MAAGGDPAGRAVVLLKAAQLGGTRLLLTSAGASIHLDPSPIPWVNTTIGASATVAKDRVEARRRANPVVAARSPAPEARDGETTVLDERCPGGGLLFRGATSPARRRAPPIRVLLLDEGAGDPATTSGGEPTVLAPQRTEAFWTRLIVTCATAGDAATLRIRPGRRGERPARRQGPLPGLRPRAAAAPVPGAPGRGHPRVNPRGGDPAQAGAAA